MEGITSATSEVDSGLGVGVDDGALEDDSVVELLGNVGGFLTSEDAEGFFGAGCSSNFDFRTCDWT